MKTVTGIVLTALVLLTSAVQAQDIEAELVGSTLTSGFTVFNSNSVGLFTVRGNGHVGIGTTTPAFKLTLDGDGGILATGTFSSGATLAVTGEGSRLFWYPKKAAFRAGQAGSTEWNDTNIGNNSVAFGYHTRANGKHSAAMGYETKASGSSSTAMGAGTEASGNYSTTMGRLTTADGFQSVAMGYETDATGASSFAMGSYATASATNSTAIGYYVAATGEYSTAIGRHVTASGYVSTAMGNYMSTNGKAGTFMIGDNSTTTSKTANTSNRFYARFADGYYFYTNSATTLGVKLLGNASSWSSVSDSTRKEGFRGTDGESVLGSFSNLRLGSWNYKEQDPLQYRHYGPMAQEWFAAFGHDGIGTIGDDVSLASADVDGILCIAVQALERRTADHREQIALLKEQLEQKDSEIAYLNDRLATIQRDNESRYTELKRLVHNLQPEQDEPAPRQAQLLESEEGQ